MSDIIIPGNRTPVQLSGPQKVCVLVHHETKRILCFAIDDQFASSFTHSGYDKIEIKHAHEKDKWMKRLREQSAIENEEQDYVYLQKENAVRQRLRQELKDRMAKEPEGAGKMAVASALSCLAAMEQKRQRYRESFFIDEAYEATKNLADLGTDLTVRKKK